MVCMFWILAIVTAARYINATTIHLPKEKWECGKAEIVNEKEMCSLYRLK